MITAMAPWTACGLQWQQAVATRPWSSHGRQQRQVCPFAGSHISMHGDALTLASRAQGLAASHVYAVLVLRRSIH